ncbi:hypothetical protein [Streptomyces sp. NPDC059649]|uniref:hypothetical protein n=1 Tax=Streptomyces sp. NPDC059649 TaxID=3346895 RepID=UPI0036819268
MKAASLTDHRLTTRDRTVSELITADGLRPRAGSVPVHLSDGAGFTVPFRPSTIGTYGAGAAAER